MSDSKNESYVAPRGREPGAPVRRVDPVDVDETDVLAKPAVPAAMEYDYTNFYFGAGDDPFALLAPFDDWYSEVKPAGTIPVEAEPTITSQPVTTSS